MPSSETLIQQFKNLLSLNMSGNFFSENTYSQQPTLRDKKHK